MIAEKKEVMFRLQSAKKRVGHDLTQGPVAKSLLVFAMPIVLANLVQQLYSMADLMVIGRFVGTTGTVGVSTGGEIADFLTPVATAFSSAGQIYIAQLAGAGRDRELKQTVGSFLSLMMILAFVFMGSVIALCDPLLNMLNCPAEAFSQAKDYMIITALGMPFIFGYNAVCGVLRGMGDSRRPLVFVTIAAVVNVFLDILLVVAFKLDAAGTAIATVASQAASFVAAFIAMYRLRDQLDFSFRLSYFRLRREHLRVIVKLGIPQAARAVLVRVSMLWVNARVNSYGLVWSSTNSVGNKLQKFLEIISISLSSAGGAMVGQNLGAEKPDRAGKTVKCALAFSLAFAALTSVIVLLFPKTVFGVFTSDPDVLDMGVVYLRIMVIHFFSSAVTSSYQCMVIGSGNAVLNFVIGIMDGVICKIGFSLILLSAFDMGGMSYFWSTALSRVIPGGICIWYFYSKRWQKHKLLK